MTHTTAADLPPDILAIIDWLVRKANGYSGRLQHLEVHSFKSDLMKRPERWSRPRVSPAVFSAACIEAGLAPDNTETLVGHLRNRQAGKRLVIDRFRKGTTLDGVVGYAARSKEDHPGPSDS